MRVLLINHLPLSGSGSGAYTANIANSLVALGHKVCVIHPLNQPESESYRFETHPVYFTPGMVKGSAAESQALRDSLAEESMAKTRTLSLVDHFDPFGNNDQFDAHDPLRSARHAARPTPPQPANPTAPQAANAAAPHSAEALGPAGKPATEKTAPGSRADQQSIGAGITAAFRAVNAEKRDRVAPIIKKEAPEGNVMEDALPFNFPCFETHPRSDKTFSQLTPAELRLYLSAFRGAIAAEVRRFKPDVIHSNHLWVLSDVAREFGLPTVVTAHGPEFRAYETCGRFRSWATSSAKRSTAIVALNDKIGRQVLDFFPFAAEKTQLIWNGYDNSMFFHGPYRREQVLGSFGIDGDWQHVVVYAGKFMKRKGIDTLLEAAKLYEGEGILTVLCGDGETYDEMEGRALRLGLESVRFLGHRNQDELRRLFNIADVTVLPARGETFGLVAIEAAACGSPIIGANQSGLERIVTPDVGTFVAPDDHFSLASTIRRITEGKLVYDHDRVAFLTHSRFSQDQFTRALVERAYAPYVE